VNELDAVAVTAEAVGTRRARVLDLPTRLLKNSEARLTARYLLVSAVIGLPASIAQLWLMVHVYTALFGGYSFWSLNAMAIINFEISVLRNYAGHCLFTWRMKPTWHRARHLHVAAIGAFVISLGMFNFVYHMTDFIPLAQLCGAASGFTLNFGYNKFKTFVREGVIEEGGLA
jgi:putative flippase GtrA